LVCLYATLTTYQTYLVNMQLKCVQVERSGTEWIGMERVFSHRLIDVHKRDLPFLCLFVWCLYALRLDVVKLQTCKNPLLPVGRSVGDQWSRSEGSVEIFLTVLSYEWAFLAWLLPVAVFIQTICPCLGLSVCLSASPPRGQLGDTPLVVADIHIGKKNCSYIFQVTRCWTQSRGMSLTFSWSVRHTREQFTNKIVWKENFLITSKRTSHNFTST